MISVLYLGRQHVLRDPDGGLLWVCNSANGETEYHHGRTMARVALCVLLMFV